MKKYLLLFIVTVGLNVINNNVDAQHSKDQQVTIKTSGRCGECKKTIEKALSFEKGVKEARFDVSTGDVAVVYNPDKTNPDKIKTSISMAGYDADSLAADPEAYKRLKPCCKKDEPKK